MRSERGFTLVELLVSFAIIALLIGVVPFAFDKLRDSAQYRDTLRGMISDIRTARQRAMSERSVVRFNIDLDRRTYGIDGMPMRTFPASLQVRTTVANTELFPGNVAAIRFLPEGGATGGSIEVVRASGTGVRLQVDWLSGRVFQEPILQ